MDNLQPVLLTELYGWACWRFNLEVKVQQQEQQVFYTINMDPFGHRSGSQAVLARHPAITELV